MDGASPPQLDFARILVVDDSGTNRSIAAKFLAKCSTRIADLRLAGSAEEALQWLRTRVFDIVFMDINLGGDISGVDIACALRRTATHRCTCGIGSEPAILAQNADAFVVAFTTDVNEEQIESYRKARMNGVLAKPFSAKSINTALQQRYGPSMPCSSTSSSFFVVTRSHAVQQSVQRPRTGTSSSAPSHGVDGVHVSDHGNSTNPSRFAAANAACSRPRVGRAITSPENMMTTTAESGSIFARVATPVLRLPTVTVSPINWSAPSDSNLSASPTGGTSTTMPRVRTRDEHQLLEHPPSSRRSSASSDAGAVSHRFSTCTLSTCSTAPTDYDSIFGDHDGAVTASGNVTSVESLLSEEGVALAEVDGKAELCSTSVDMDRLSVYSLTPPAEWASSVPSSFPDSRSTATNTCSAPSDGLPPSPTLSSTSQRSWRSLRRTSPPGAPSRLDAKSHGGHQISAPWAQHHPLNLSALSIDSVASSPPHLGASVPPTAAKFSPRASPYSMPFNRVKARGDRKAASARSMDTTSSKVGLLGPGVRFAKRLRGE